ncbi:hypothetical protein CMK22_12910 [Candidatus Poribacteria bacterium]|nr:hypothetical protein [Candidatus Poribacteria bacterium]|tara:strand:+ start:275 stop:1183 length:909 start_codon:yes stop_codon:yes gene_type:complete
MKNYAFRIAIIVVISCVLSCADRPDRYEAPAPESPEAQAAEALNLAQEAMKAAGIDIEFNDLGDLAELSSVLPTPEKLTSLNDQQVGQMQTATDEMYKILEVVGESGTVPSAPLNPAKDTQPILSNADLLLVNLNLSYLNVLEAVRLLSATGEDIYKIEYSQKAGYTFKLTKLGKTKLDQAKPGEFIRDLSEDQRQAIVDSLFMLTGAKVKASDLPGMVKTIKRMDWQNAIHHLDKMLNLAKEIAPDLGVAMIDFNDIIADTLSKGVIDQVTKWGFEIENYDEVINKIKNLVSDEAQKQTSS